LTTPDSDLLERARAYDPEALAEIYDRYAIAIYRYLYRYLGDGARAEDMTSEVFVRLLQALKTSRAPRDKLRGWLYRVAHNLAMDWFRQSARVSEAALDADLVVGGHSPSTAVEERQAQQALRAALRQLTPGQQQVIVLRFGEGLKISEVSQIMGKSEGAVKILQHRAVKRLEKLLEQMGTGSDE
jgi:RNA polymerase sigma-70 factor (ECF subfamily)